MKGARLRDRREAVGAARVLLGFVASNSADTELKLFTYGER